MGARFVIAVILSAVVFGGFFYLAKPDEAKQTTEETVKKAKEISKTGVKKTGETAKKVQEEGAGWFVENWWMAAAGLSIVILLVCLMAGGKKDQRRDAMKKND